MEQVLLKSYDQLANTVRFKHSMRGCFIKNKDKALTKIGYGRSAYVFRIGASNQVLKVFYPPYEHLAKKEAMIYQKLEGAAYYPRLYSYGDNFLVIDYIEGFTLFECLAKGVEIEKHYIDFIDEALDLAREKGLNPSDIHLHNIIVTPNKEIKLIDVARFEQTKRCSQWADLKSVYYNYYLHRFFPKKIPASLMYFIAKLYRKNLLKYFY
ncbi:RIO1 family regulatory kinase/ATPase domain-containing protein [Sutcliffiella deserti]|uniref:RIO1 family regulatory kinase/ATPase domain-containing protein n=1 Tax=Sutcliffiella deserti TaxID=2875501 RepID=UPI001CC093CB|nr:RIO1 family regulatory kinase/ATPase [Sutcliffiella deserti]